MRHFLDLDIIETNHLETIIDNAQFLKNSRKGFKKGKKDNLLTLSNIAVGLIFEKPSTRTRVSFELGINQLGGKSVILSKSDIHLGKNETISDTARVLSKYLDLLMIRTFSHESLFEFSANATVPVINGLTDHSHPCQVMADVMTFNEMRDTIKGKKVVWFGPANNVFNSYVHASKKFEFDLFFGGPNQLKPEKKIVLWADKNDKKIFFEDNPQKAASGSDLIVTDTQISMHEEGVSSETRQKMLKKYQVNNSLMSLAKKDALFMHCLPAHRNFEVTDEIIDGRNSVVFEVAENRMHIQKSILNWCLGYI